MRQDGRPLEHPDWSPDGRSIIYNPTGCSACEQIELMPADDPTATPDVLYPGDAPTHGFKPVYSPDGSRIAFGCVPGLCLMDADGSNVVTLATTVGWRRGQPFRLGKNARRRRLARCEGVANRRG